MGLQNAIDGASPVMLLAQSGASVSHTGDTTETVLATTPIPSNLLDANGIVWIRANWAKTGTAGTWTPKMYLGTSGQGTGGSALWTPGAQGATTLGAISLLQVANRNATNAQSGSVSNLNGVGGNAAAAPTATVDTTVATEIVVSIALGNAADTVALGPLQVLAYPHA